MYEEVYNGWHEGKYHLEFSKTRRMQVKIFLENKLSRLRMLLIKSYPIMEIIRPTPRLEDQHVAWWSEKKLKKTLQQIKESPNIGGWMLTLTDMHVPTPVTIDCARGLIAYILKCFRRTISPVLTLGLLVAKLANTT